MTARTVLLVSRARSDKLEQWNANGQQWEFSHILNFHSCQTVFVIFSKYASRDENHTMNQEWLFERPDRICRIAPSAADP